ncbi:hypothetical protein [Clostridium sp. ZBS4]|uniref:hypothetical protein n=1 Tax=Clostridium sp. ZBS4 TaxID=2949974 RepID=UPI00207AC893|nr:hypothetical protein [Clostridium sp. ZBS4]
MHKQGLIMLENDLNSIANLLKPTTNISKNHIELVKSNYELLHEMENIYIQYASNTDKVENRYYFEKYEFIPDYGMKIRKVKCIQVPFIFSQHFHSPCTTSNYMQTENKVIKLMCRSKLKLIKSLGYDIKKQGLTFNAMKLFLIHAENAIKLSENNNYKLNNEIIKELLYATHYLEDLCKTHHSTNKIGLGKLSFLLRIKFLKNKKFKRLSNHSDFENYAFKNKNKYIINSVKEFRKIKSLREEEKEFWE